MLTLLRTRMALARLRLPSFAALLRAVATMRAVRRQRRALLRLDDALLRDIGLDAQSVHEEASRPIWDVPRHWRR